jgi:hypothetical protein
MLIHGCKTLKKTVSIIPLFSDDVFNVEEKAKIKADYGITITKKEPDIIKFEEGRSFLNNLTEHPIESTLNSELKNVSTKSMILAPFNSSTSNMSSELE